MDKINKKIKKVKILKIWGHNTMKQKMNIDCWLKNWINFKRISLKVGKNQLQKRPYNIKKIGF